MGKAADDQFMGRSKNTQPGHNYNKPKPAAKKAAPPTPRAKPAQKAVPPTPRAKPAAKKASPKSGASRSVQGKRDSSVIGRIKRGVRRATGDPTYAGPNKVDTSDNKSAAARVKTGAKRIVGKEGGLKASAKSLKDTIGPRSTSTSKRNYSRRGGGR